MKIKLKIEQPGYNPDGNRHFNVTSFLVSHSDKNAKSMGRMNHRGENVFQSNRGGYSYGRRQEDPVFDNLAKVFEKIFFKDRWDTSYKKFYSEMTFKYSDGNVVLLIGKDSGFTLNGKRLNKTVITAILARVAYRSCFVRSKSILRPYLKDLLQVPPNVRWAMENRTPYFFYGEEDDNPYMRNKIEVMVNTRRISRDSCALEISENIWAEFPIVELDKFLNVYRLNQARSKKWLHISPRNLWRQLFGSSCTESEHSMMIAWLMQNRTEDMVERRAKELMDELHEENEGIHVFKLNDKQAMFIRGKLCDWVLVENNAAKSSPQRVHIYCLHENSEQLDRKIIDIGQNIFLNCALRGPICVNNSVGNVSLGDQFASRAFTLLNDKLAFQMVSTLKAYTPKSAHKIKQPYYHRVNYDTLKEWKKVEVAI